MATTDWVLPFFVVVEEIIKFLSLGITEQQEEPRSAHALKP